MFSVVCVCLFTGGPHVTITHDTIGHVVTIHPTIQGPLPHPHLKPQPPYSHHTGTLVLPSIHVQTYST